MALLSPDSSKTPAHSGASSTSSSRTGLAPILTAAKPAAQAARNRYSTFSLQSNASGHAINPLSRPVSMAFPQFHSSLEYALVRDFAYPPYHPFHYGPPPPDQSGTSTPASELQQRRVSDPAPSYDSTRGDWQSKTWDNDPLPQTAYAEKRGDGPPYREDDDLASPVVTASRHRKNKSSDDNHYFRPNGTAGASVYRSTNQPPPGNVRVSQSILSNRAYQEEPPFSVQEDSEGDGDEDDDDDEHRRFSRDYQFTIVSPDEEMHGRAVALFDFQAENENELSMTEGMIVFISFRHGEGWLVAQDLRSGESGLVPEQYVRLLRDIEGGYDGLFQGNGDIDEARTPTQETSGFDDSHEGNSNHEQRNYQPVVSTFSISREDLEPIPKERLNSPTSATPTEQSKKSLDDALKEIAAKDKKPEKQATN